MSETRGPWTEASENIPHEVADEEIVTRRFPPDQYHSDKGRLKSTAFHAFRSPYQISVDRRKYRNLEATLSVSGDFGAACLVVGEIRALPLNVDVVEQRIPEDPEQGVSANPAHANIEVATEYTKSKLGKICRELSNLAKVVQLPEAIG